jgi:hypothetical protein
MESQAPSHANSPEVLCCESIKYIFMPESEVTCECYFIFILSGLHVTSATNFGVLILNADVNADVLIY